ncbi:MAG: hypothetical protein ING24_00085 [Roseomonas sp.]|nr:hypothetical protein [Roseomonas sp.]MCA3340826.1 hypothetical protein [Roseomonas sp.]
MEFGILMTSHPNPVEEPYPHQGVTTRTTEEILRSLTLFAQHVIPAFHPSASCMAAE